MAQKLFAHCSLGRVPPARRSPSRARALFVLFVSLLSTRRDRSCKRLPVAVPVAYTNVANAQGRGGGRGEGARLLSSSFPPVECELLNVSDNAPSEASRAPLASPMIILLYRRRSSRWKFQRRAIYRLSTSRFNNLDDSRRARTTPRTTSANNTHGWKYNERAKINVAQCRVHRQA